MRAPTSCRAGGPRSADAAKHWRIDPRARTALHPGACASHPNVVATCRCAGVRVPKRHASSMIPWAARSQTRAETRKRRGVVRTHARSARRRVRPELSIGFPTSISTTRSARCRARGTCALAENRVARVTAGFLGNADRADPASHLVLLSPGRLPREPRGRVVAYPSGDLSRRGGCARRPRGGGAGAGNHARGGRRVDRAAAGDAREPGTRHLLARHPHRR